MLLTPLGFDFGFFDLVSKDTQRNGRLRFGGRVNWLKGE
jgi:hypothetical protein